ncbi:DUF885 domain-containing protein [Hyphococcus flavus]|uniref:DUF885 domain-containing protein n=1 Tax=Hyphococcus flavus TaxID=1866326 RepID=A0AAF0CGA5_9PROT|nr:DUF885 domain-containing protein [Hyphococcus flavus]WDI32144.1 DUF885 domain-containing protein [Hyphococcus flavus]
MNRLIAFFASSLLLGTALVSCAQQEDTQDNIAPADQGAEVNAIADAYLEAIKTIAPFQIVFSSLGEDVPIANDAFDLNTPEADAAYERTEDELLARIAKIDPETLANRADWVAYQSLKAALQSSKRARVCKQSGWSLNHMFGWQNALPIIASMQPVATEEERAAALERWSKLPAYIAQDEVNLRRGLAEGYSVPKRVAARVIAQLDALIEAPAANLPFIAFAADADDQFKMQAQRLAEDEIKPALISFRTFLNNEYMPSARDDLAITAVPNGAECYEALLQVFHTADIGSKATHENGQAAVNANTAAVIERGEALFGTDDFAEILERVKTAPGNRFESEQELIDFTRAEVAITKEKAAPFFSKLPEQEMGVEPYPDYLKGTGQSSRYESTPPSQGTATYRINTDEWETQTRGEAQIVAVHEGWPGHHLQIATAYAVEGLHPIVQMLSSSGYVEGWARYAEALAEEAGMYNDYGPISRRAWPARGMVLDTGLHAYGWSEEEVKQFAMASGRFNEESAEVLLDRIAVIPGQLTAYDTGGLEIFALRREAEERLGEKFDIKEFHDRILENGAVPLSAMREHVETWIAENK